MNKYVKTKRSATRDWIRWCHPWFWTLDTTNGAAGAYDATTKCLRPISLMPEVGSFIQPFYCTSLHDSRLQLPSRLHPCCALCSSPSPCPKNDVFMEAHWNKQGYIIGEEEEEKARIEKRGIKRKRLNLEISTHNQVCWGPRLHIFLSIT